MKKRIACFFTGGYTELYGMTQFLKKINGEAGFIKLTPTRERKSKEDIRNRARHMEMISKRESGLTGKKLIDHVKNFVQEERFKEERYDMILIEDDKDDRFLTIQADGTAAIDEKEWETFKQEVQEQLQKAGVTIPIIMIMAAPEVEAWFLADWDNSFGQEYRQILSNDQNQYFSTKFRIHINEEILTERYKNDIESYGYFDSQYVKLSERIQKSLEEIDFMGGYSGEYPTESVRYSKTKNGGRMLANIEPQSVLQKCPHCFREGYYKLQEL